MSTLHAQPPLSRPMAWIGVVLLAVLVAVGLARWSGLNPRTPDAAVQWQRALFFSDQPDGDIVVLDASYGQKVARFAGEQGFLRSTLRALVRERMRVRVRARVRPSVVRASKSRRSRADVHGRARLAPA